MSAISNFGQRQQQLLSALLHHRGGLSVEQLTQTLNISRNAVNQHLSSLEAQGLVKPDAYSNTGGRPSKLYALTDSGLELFPRHYDLLASLLMGLLRQKLGTTELQSSLQELGEQLAQQFLPRLQQKDITEKIEEVARIMQELGYETRVDGQETIVASNCVFHKLAEECHEVCALDRALLSKLIAGKSLDHDLCMVKGDNCCRFVFKD